MGEPLLSAGDPFIPHSYCGADGTHPVLLLPTIPNVTVEGKPIGLELGFTSCGDLVLCQGIGKVFVNDPIGSRRSIGGGAADPNEKVTLAGYPRVVYDTPANLVGIYDVTQSNNRFESKTFTFRNSAPRGGSQTDAYTVLNVTNIEGSTREVRNYPGPPLSRLTGVTGPLPAYARAFENPIGVSFRMLPTITLYTYADSNRVNLRFHSTRSNPLSINEDTGEISNFQALDNIFFPQRANGSELILPFAAFRVLVYGGFNFYGTKYFPDEPQGGPGMASIYFYLRTNTQFNFDISDQTGGSNAGNGRDPGSFGSTGGIGGDGGRFGSTGGNGR